MQIAINVADLTALEAPGGINIGAILVSSVTAGRITVDANPRAMDESALVLECDDERALAIVQMLNRRAVVRAYTSENGETWKRLRRKA